MEKTSEIDVGLAAERHRDRSHAERGNEVGGLPRLSVRGRHAERSRAGAWERGLFCGRLESGQAFLAALPICVRRNGFGLVELITIRGAAEFSGLQG
jgi:hypothetical protein